MTNPTVHCRALVLIALALLVGCGKSDKQEPSPAPPSESAWMSRLPAPADQQVTDLLEGLKAGDNIDGFPVVQVGAVDKDGVIQIVFVKDGAAVTVVVAALSSAPKPPAATSKYGVYYQRFNQLQSVPSDKALRLVQGIADRLKRTEDKFPEPTGLKKLPRPGQPT